MINLDKDYDYCLRRWILIARGSYLYLAFTTDLLLQESVWAIIIVWIDSSILARVNFVSIFGA